MDVLGPHLSEIHGGVGTPDLHRYPEAYSVLLVEGSVNNRRIPLHHVFEEVLKVCDWVGMSLLLQLLENMIEFRLSVELRECDGELWSSIGW